MAPDDRAGTGTLTKRSMTVLVGPPWGRGAGNRGQPSKGVTVPRGVILVERVYNDWLVTGMRPRDEQTGGCSRLHRMVGSGIKYRRRSASNCNTACRMG